MKKYLWKSILLSFVLLFGFSNTALAQDFSTPADIPFEETLEATVTDVLEDSEIELSDGELQIYQQLELVVDKGSLEGEIIFVESGNYALVGNQRYKEGDKLIIMHNKDFEGNDVFFVSDYVRRDALLVLFIIFVVVALAVGKVWGITSLVGMSFSFLVIFKFILPQIMSGGNPILIAILGSLLIIPVTFYLSHGLNKKTTIAIVSTVIALIITGILANVFVEAARLTGFASEEAAFLQVASQGAVNIKGLLLAGIIIGALGVLDDVTVSQASIVNQLKQTDKKMSFKELYGRAMKVGQDHTSSMVNTLVLVYTGAALPLLLLFIDRPHPFLEVINYEILADEIVRTLVGSIGLILAVPITTLLACFYFGKKSK
jgi:uncharacterized membrane protein